MWGCSAKNNHNSVTNRVFPTDMWGCSVYVRVIVALVGVFPTNVGMFRFIETY